MLVETTLPLRGKSHDRHEPPCVSLTIGTDDGWWAGCVRLSAILHGPCEGGGGFGDALAGLRASSTCRAGAFAAGRFPVQDHRGAGKQDVRWASHADHA